MTHHVYILECADKTLYVGCTNNLEKRLIEHNSQKCGAHYTKIRRPVVLKYSESFETLAEARKREAEIKRWSREKKLKLITNHMSKYGPKAQKKISKVMHEFGKGKLKSGTSLKKVTSQKQAVAIGISEARREGDKVPKEKKKNNHPMVK
jgi:putative endonuclease